MPGGLAVETFRDQANQRYLFVVSDDHPGEGCRAGSSYNVWVLLPKLPEGYNVDFAVSVKHPVD